MNAEILCVGTELLLGDTVNTNAAYLAKELAACGIGCYYQTVVGDNPERLKNCLAQALARADMVITTGGLGPTYDDLTKETVAAYFGRSMELHEASLLQITEVFRRLGRPMTKSNEKQAYMPQGARVFANDRGTAPGLAVEDAKQGKIVVMLPGPPREMTAMFQSQVRPYLLSLSDTTLVSHNIHLFGIGESSVEDLLHRYMQEHHNPTVAPYAKEGEVLLRVTASAATREQADALIRPVVDELCGLLQEYVYGVDVDTLQNALVQALGKAGKTIATAESCTGGLVSKRITEVPGASQVFSCGVCTYSNEMKTQLLGVPAETLQAHGAVSAQTALAMAEGVRRLAGANFGISVTGIAGPDGGTPEKPVGLVYVAVSGEGKEQAVELQLSRRYGGERVFIRSSAASNALHLALRAVQAATPAQR